MKHYTGDGRPVTEGNYYTGGKGPIIDGSASDEEQSDIEYKQEDSDGEYMGEGRTNAKQSFGHGNRKKQKYEVKEKTPNPNGRVVGRKLVMWHRKSFRPSSTTSFGCIYILPTSSILHLIIC